MENEEWRPIPGYSGYSASNLGRIKNADGKILKQTKNPKGYMRVGISSDKGAKKQTGAHRFVALAFGLIEESDCVNHIDGVKDNNHVSNLEKSNHSHNGLHAYRQGLSKPQLGENHGKAKLTKEQAIEVLKLRHEGLLLWEIGERFGVKVSTVSAVVTGQNWPELNHMRKWKAGE